ncbi:MAG: amidohydrolase family protein [Gammaproteobacteria bacterium]|nr:amidohydrolase family protein [Gammaproteobacteria bacterium]
MKTAAPIFWAILWTLGAVHAVSAQNLVVRNAHILDGNGGTIDTGTLVIRNGRISAYEEDSDTADFDVLDAEGMIVIPSFTDAHRQVVRGDPDEWLAQAEAHMREYLEAGITTLVTVDENLEPVLTLRDRLESLEFEGPRLLVTGPVPLTNDAQAVVPEADLREAVQNLAFEGLDGIASTVRASAQGAERQALSITRDEANNQGLLLITHVDSVRDAEAAVAGNSGYLTRTPHVGEFDAASARGLVNAGRNNAEYGTVMTSTLAEAMQAGSNSPSLANARTLWDAGIIYGYGSASSLPPREALQRELAILQESFSNEEILAIMTKNSSLASRRDDALGTLDRGKFADMIFLNSDPLADIENLFDIALVMKTGRIVVDNR